MADKKMAAAMALKERTQKKRFKLTEGDTTFRVLPNATDVENGAEFADYGMHSEVGARKAFLRCGKSKSGKGACWLCDEQIPQLTASGKSAHIQHAERIRRRDIFAVQIAYYDKGVDKWIGPVLWETPNRISNDLLGLMQRRNISDPENGYDLTINRTGTGMKDTRYGSIERADDKSAVDPDIMAKLKPFKEVISKYDEAKMKAAYFGHDQEDEDPSATEAEEEPVVKAAKKKPAPPPEDVDEDELVEEEPVEEEVEDEPAPKVVGKKKPTPPTEEDEDDAAIAALEEFDEEIPSVDEEEVEEVKPAAKKVAPSSKKKAAPVEEEEEEAPAPKPKAKAPVAVGKPKPKPAPADDEDY